MIVRDPPQVRDSQSWVLTAVLLLIAALVVGCTSTKRRMMPTPALYGAQSGSGGLFVDTPRERRTPDVKLLFITDRAPETDPESELPFGEGRSQSLAFGTAVVEMVPGLTWTELEVQSRLSRRTRNVDLELGRVTEIGRFPQVPYDVEPTAAGVVRSAGVLDAHRSVRADFQKLVQRQLLESPTKEVVLYVHGFNETFATAAYTMGELCHFLGRQHVCAIFSWPASASGNLLLSYATTTESADYSVINLVKTIRLLARTPGVKGLHLIAHSRGSAVLVDALHELAIETVAAGVDPVNVLKINNVALMAPDIDIQVAGQKLQVLSSDPDMITRWTGNHLPELISGRFTIYSSPQDRALSISRFLFRSRRRLGQLSLEEWNEEIPDSSTKSGQLDIVVYEGQRTDLFGHGYFATNPRVSSDLIRLIRDGTKPGEPGRALKKIGPVSWTFPGSDAQPERQ